MSRNRASAKAAGANFEKLIADYLAVTIDDRIERRRLNGKNDRGDIAALRTNKGRRLVVECKSYGGRLEATTWVKEAEVERVNDSALAGIVVAKRRGTNKPEEQFVIMSLRDFVAILKDEDRD